MDVHYLLRALRHVIKASPMHHNHRAALEWLANYVDKHIDTFDEVLEREASRA